ncbi:MAG: dihydrolipoamide acetyltransferase family protein [Gammaproteobacteria bacterium]
MKIFYLPDLGEGLAEAEIHEWHVKVGDEVKVDQPMVSVETAKAVVDVPSPQAGKIAKLYGKPGDIIPTGGPLVEFEGGEEQPAQKDKGTVVGSLEESDTVLAAGDMIVGATQQTKTSTVKAMPAVRALAKQLNVDINLVPPSGPQGQITAADVKKFASQKTATHPSVFQKNTAGGSVEALHGVRRVMATAMSQSHQEIVPVTIVDDADITDLPEGADITVSLIQAIVTGVQAEPSLNAWYDGKTMERCLMKQVHIGLAVDTQEGLFVPVLKDVANQSVQEVRAVINRFKKSVRDRSIAPSELQGATITLSNFGMIAGRYATPIIVPPMVAILGCGKIREAVMPDHGRLVIRRMMPLSLTFDHRAVTGGEATRFLGAVIKNLEERR